MFFMKPQRNSQWEEIHFKLIFDSGNEPLLIEVMLIKKSDVRKISDTYTF